DFAAPVDRNQTDAGLDQPPGQQQALPVLVPAVALPQSLWLAAQVEGSPRLLGGQQGQRPLPVAVQVEGGGLRRQMTQPAVEALSQRLAVREALWLVGETLDT